MPSRRTSAARDVNLAEVRRARASLWLMMYRSSEAGKEGARGTAMALEARMERRVTEKRCQLLLLDMSKRKARGLERVAHLHSHSCSQSKRQLVRQQCSSHPSRCAAVTSPLPKRRHEEESHS